jgi:glycosyltransferase involved in cell wall biosynthesis
MSTARFLWICPKSPLGPPDGARMATSSLIKGLKAQGAEIHLVITTDETDLVAAEITRVLGVASTRVFERPRPIQKWTPRIRGAMTLKTYEHPDLQTNVRTAISEVKPTHVIFDGLHTAATVPMRHFRELQTSGIKLIYRAHNVESLLWSQTAHIQKNLLLPVFLNREAHIVQSFEDVIVEYVNATATVSEHDARSLRDRVPEARVECVPIGLEFPTSPEPMGHNGTQLDLLFVGGLNWRPNKQGLDWFFDQVWSRLSRRDLRLHIAGEGAKIFDTHGAAVMVHGRVEDLVPLYQKAHLTLAPLLTGSGTRVKAIEAARFGRACLGTPIGLMGLPLANEKNAWIEHKAERWIEVLEGLTFEQCQKRGSAAFEGLRDQFELNSCAKRFMNLALSASSSPHRRA